MANRMGRDGVGRPGPHGHALLRIAAREGRAVDFDAVLAFCRSQIAGRQDVLLIEGVGGVMVPLDDSHTVLDWMAALELPVLLVAGSYLGAISHTLTALDALGRRRLGVTAVIISETPGSAVDLMETAATVQRFASAIPVLTLPRAEVAVLEDLASRL